MPLYICGHSSYNVRTSQNSRVSVVSVVVFDECDLEIVGFPLCEMNSGSFLKPICRTGMGLANIPLILIPCSPVSWSSNWTGGEHHPLVTVSEGDIEVGH